MTIAEFTALESAEAEDVLRWRFRALVAAGYELEAAAVLASRVDVDLHRACDLVQRGCPAATALRILL